MTRIQRSDSTMNWRYRNYGSDPWTTKSKVHSSTSDLQISSNHYPLQTEMDDGGSFLMRRIWWKPVYGVLTAPPPGYTWRYDGEFTVGNPTGLGAPAFGTVTRLADSALLALGTTAIARVEPLNPAWDASTFLGELMREGLPSATGFNVINNHLKYTKSSDHFDLMRNQAKYARTAGGEYLNVEFGWLPLVRGVQDFAKTVINSHDILESYRKGSDLKIRRRYEFPTNATSTTQWKGQFLPDPATDINVGLTGTLTEVRKTRTWFSGAFRYHVPTSSTQLGKFREWRSNAQLLLGVDLTPEVLWNLAPWSWAVDWFSNVGDVMHNISALGRDGLVLQYGYAMDHRSVDSYVGATLNYQGQSRQTSLHRRDEWKMRLPSTPYGFGVNLSSLSPRQIAVIAALGLSKT